LQGNGVLDLRIIGIDPGYAIVGYGAVEFSGHSFKVIEYGAITTKADQPFDQRLFTIDCTLSEILERLKPDSLAVEKLFFNTNQKTAIDVAQARGVIVAAAVRAGVGVYEYTPLQIKTAVVGYGRAEKKQVQEMIKIILNLSEVPKPDDTADALAIAICHAHSARSVLYEYENTR